MMLKVWITDVELFRLLKGATVSIKFSNLFNSMKQITIDHTWIVGDVELDRFDALFTMNIRKPSWFRRIFG